MRGRPGHRRRQLALHRGRPARKTVGRQGNRVHRRRCVGWCLGAEGGLRPDGRRQRRGRRAGDADLRHAAPARRAGGRVRPRGPGRCGPLRQDGAQRHRVRADDGLRRGLRDAGRRGSDQGSAGRLSRRGPTARWCGPGCSNCWPRRSRRIRSSTEITGYTEDSGEGRWTVEEAIRLRVPVPGIAASLFARFASRQDDSPTMKAVSALRNQFGGHAVKRSQRVRIGADVCTSATWDCRTSGRGRRSTWISNPGRTVFVGPNGFGKTNLVEALWYSSTLGSHRVAIGRAADPGGRRARGDLDDRGERRPRAGRRPRDHGGPRQQGAAEPLPRPRRPARCSACCGRCCSRPRIWRWCAGIPANAGATSTNWPPRGDRGSAAVRADYDKVLRQRDRAAEDRRRPRAIAVTAVCSTPSTCGTATSPRTARN